MSIPRFFDMSQRIQNELKKMSPSELSSLHDINLRLAELNFERNQNWSADKLKRDGSPALFTFSGDVYRGLDAQTLDRDDLAFIEDKLFIISGLYGLLRPFDAILPYRLEMGTKLSVGNASDLYQYWQNVLTDYLAELKEDFFVNLASKEYSDVINFKKLDAQVYECTFLDLVKNSYRPVNIYLKLARGLMVRFIIKNRIKNPEDLKFFNYENYTYDQELSTEFLFVFKRERIS